jgi:hypothetical protein
MLSIYLIGAILFNEFTRWRDEIPSRGNTCFTFTNIYVINKKSVGDMLSGNYQLLILIFVPRFAGSAILKFFEKA